MTVLGARCGGGSGSVGGEGSRCGGRVRDCTTRGRGGWEMTGLSSDGGSG